MKTQISFPFPVSYNNLIKCYIMSKMYYIGYQYKRNIYSNELY